MHCSPALLNREKEMLVEWSNLASTGICKKVFKGALKQFEIICYMRERQDLSQSKLKNKINLVLVTVMCLSILSFVACSKSVDKKYVEKLQKKEIMLENKITNAYKNKNIEDMKNASSELNSLAEKAKNKEKIVKENLGKIEASYYEILAKISTKKIAEKDADKISRILSKKEFSLKHKERILHNIVYRAKRLKVNKGKNANSAADNYDLKMAKYAKDHNSTTYQIGNMKIK